MCVMYLRCKHMCLFTYVLTDAFGESRGAVHQRVTRWLSGARDRRAGSEPARKKKKRTGPAAVPQDGEAPPPAEEGSAVGREEGEELAFLHL